MTTAKRPDAGSGGLRLRVVGRVQGVGFRYFIIRRAEELGLAGYARNLDDGAVEIWAEGAAGALSALAEAARQGPRGARVDEVEVERGAATGAYRGFGVRF
jgi:acylphosphatase